MMALNPIFLWMLPLAGLPLLFHLFFRVRRRSRPFSSLMFFRQADPRLSARRRIREWLALLLRTLVILFLLAALSRPVWSGGRGVGLLSAVLLVDNSASMDGAGPGGRRKLDLALEAASAVISGLGPGDAAAVVPAADDPGLPLPAGLLSDAAAVRASLDRVEATEASGQPARALANALALVGTGVAARREVHVFSDAQENEWGKTPADAPRAPPGTSIVVHRIPSAAGARPNVSMAGLALPPRRLLAGRRAGVRVEVFNPGGLDAAVRLNAADDGGARSAEALTVPAHQSRTVTLPVRLGPEGFHWVHAWIEQDGFGGDNHAYAGYVSAAREYVLFLGPESAFDLLPAAVSPSADGVLSGLAPVFDESGAAADALQRWRPVMVAAPGSVFQADPAGSQLREYVERGGVLLVTACSADAGFGPLPDWAGAAPQAAAESPAGFPVSVFDRESALWDELRDRKGDIALRDVRAFRFYPLVVSADARVLMGLEDGRALLCERPVGLGRVFVSGFAFHPQWSSLPLRAAVLALAQSMALLRDGGAEAVLSLSAGDPLPEARFAGRSARVASLAGRALEWEGDGATIPPFARSGVYRVSSGESAAYVAVSAAAAEGREEFLSGPAIPALGRMDHQVWPYEGTQGMLSRLRRTRRGLELYLPLVLLGLACAMAESGVVNPAPRKDRGAGRRRGRARKPSG